MSTKITDIYLRYLNGNVSRVELDILFLYFEQATEEEMQALIKLGFEQPAEQSIDPAITDSLQKVHQRLLSYTGRSKRTLISWKTIRYAVAASLLLVCGLSYLFMQKTNDLSHDIAAPIASLLVKGENGSTLSIANSGDSIWTGDQVTYHLIDSQTLRMSIAQNIEKPVEQTFYTERSDFQLILEDGSIIKLNAHSSLKLQVPFGKIERKVELKGEGFFDIAHEQGRPFKVYASNNLIEVLGTQFNIRNYPEDREVTTALIRGKIALSQQGFDQRVILLPGQKAISDASGIHVMNTGTKQATAWKDRFFAYEDQPLNSVLMDIARWYDVDIDTQSMPKGKHIYMKINKEQKLSEVLKLMGATSNMQFSLQHGKIYTDTTATENIDEQQ